MRPDDIHGLLHKRPFQPFRIRLSNGTTYDIRHPELVVVGRSTMFIGVPAPDLPPATYDDFALVSLMQLAEVTPVIPASSSES
jgi:hypothetical protein